MNAITFILNNKKSITPKGFHILNHGFRKDATHTTLDKPPWSTIDEFEFRDDQIIDINNSVNSTLEKIISSECGLPIQENYPLEVMRLIKFYLKKYIIKFIHFLSIKKFKKTKR